MAVKPSSNPAAKAPSAADDRETANKKAIIKAIRGPVMDKVVSLIPALGAYPNPYQSVISNPDLLFACVQLVRKQREVFQDLLVGLDGSAVLQDDVPLLCNRTVDQIVGMLVRSGCKAYADIRWAPEPAVQSQAPVKPESKGLLDKLRELVSGKWGDMEQPKPTPTQAQMFYQAINEHLEYDWQIPLIPYFAELPLKLLNELGRGCTQLRNPEAIAQLADMGRHNLDQARKILADDMMREMLDTQPLAAKGVAFLGKETYDFLHNTVYDKMGENFWEMCVDCGRLEAIEEQNAKDLEQMALYLHIIGPDTIQNIVKFMEFSLIPVFLQVASERLGDEKFAEIFGIPGNKKLIKMFCEKTKAYKLDVDDPVGDLTNRLPDVFNAYLRSPVDFEKGL